MEGDVRIIRAHAWSTAELVHLCHLGHMRCRARSAGEVGVSGVVPVEIVVAYSARRKVMVWDRLERVMT